VKPFVRWRKKKGEGENEALMGEIGLGRGREGC